MEEFERSLGNFDDVKKIRERRNNLYTELYLRRKRH